MITIRLRGVDIPVTADWYNPTYRAGIRHCFAILSGFGQGLSSHLFDYEGTSLHLESDMWHIAAALVEMSNEQRVAHGWIDLFPGAAMAVTYTRHHPPELIGIQQNLSQQSGLPLLGVPQLDNEHAELRRRIDALNECRQRSADKTETLGLVRELQGGWRKHFAHEEELMVNDHYPQAAAHMREHRLILEVMDTIGNNLEAARITLDEEVIADLREWETYHILVADHNYTAYMRGTQR